MRSTDQIRVLHLVGGKLLQGGTASVVRNLVAASDSSVANLIWVHRDCPEERDLLLVREGSSQIVSASICGDLIGAVRDLPRLLRTIRQLDIAILHAHTRAGILAGWLAHQFARTPLIVHLHFLASRPWLYRFLIRTAGATVIYNSHRTCQHYGGVPGKDYIVMPTLKWPTTELEESSTPRIVAVSALVPNKKVDVIIEACSALQNRDEPLGLIIYGLLSDEFASATQRELLGKYQHLSFVTFEKWTCNWADLVRSCDIFVHAGTSESFGLSILEAFACGLRIVVPRETFVAAFASDSPNSGVYFIANQSVAELADTIRVAISDSVQSTDLRRMRRAIACEFSPEVAAKRINKIYRIVVPISD